MAQCTANENAGDRFEAGSYWEFLRGVFSEDVTVFGCLSLHCDPSADSAFRHDRGQGIRSAANLAERARFELAVDLQPFSRCARGVGSMRAAAILVTPP